MQLNLVILIVGLLGSLALAEPEQDDTPNALAYNQVLSESDSEVAEVNEDLDRAGTIWIGRPPYGGYHGHQRPHRPSYGYGKGRGYGGYHGHWNARPYHRYNDWGHRWFAKPGGNWILGR